MNPGGATQAWSRSSLSEGEGTTVKIGGGTALGGLRGRQEQVGGCFHRKV